MNYRFTVVIEKDENGYFAYCPELQGATPKGTLLKGLSRI